LAYIERNKEVHRVREQDQIAEWAGGPLFICAFARSQNRPVPQTADDIIPLIEPSLEAMGYRLVRVAFLGARRATLQIMAERRDNVPMTVDDCTEISRSVSAILDVADPIADAYMLEVSSPGIDRPLTRPEDYDRFAGFEAKIELGQPIDGRKRFRGKLLGRAADQVRLVGEAGEVSLPFAAIAKAKLVITPELLAARSTPLH
jgi:ribosome maturation factor RimP